MFDWSQAKKAVQDLQSKNKPGILIVDDEEANRRVLSELLSNQYEAHQASGGQEALDFLETDLGDSIAALVIDHRMPGMTGIQLCKELKKKGNPIPRIMLTAYSELHDVISLVNEAGIFRYLPKPLEESVVRDAVGQAVRSRQLEQENLKLIGIVSRLTAECEDFRTKLGPSSQPDPQEDKKSRVKKPPRKKTVNVICGDLRGFTQFSNEAAPDIVISGLQAVIEEVHVIVYKHGGMIDKHNGDGFVAIFGMDTDLASESNEQALNCLEELVESYGKIRQTAFGEIEHQLCLGLGLSRGEVLVGELGSEFRKDVVIFGDSMAMAERLQELTKSALSHRNGASLLGSFSEAMAICPAPLVTNRPSFQSIQLNDSISVREFANIKDLAVFSK